MIGAPEHKKNKLRKTWSERDIDNNVFKNDLFIKDLFTLFTHADIKHTRAQAVSRRNTETSIIWIHCHISKDLAGRTKTIPRDALNRHILLVYNIQRSGTENNNDESIL